MKTCDLSEMEFQSIRNISWPVRCPLGVTGARQSDLENIQLASGSISILIVEFDYRTLWRDLCTVFPPPFFLLSELTFYPKTQRVTINLVLEM